MVTRRGFLRGATSASLALPLLGRGIAHAAEDWQAEWDRTIAAAHKEGSVVACMSPSKPRRDFLVSQWKQDYPGIELSLSTVSGSAFVPQVATERSAGRYLWDIFHSGAPSSYSAIRQGLLDPLLPELFLPEVKDPAVWGGWDNAFYDKGKKYDFALVSDLIAPSYNARAIPPEKVKALGSKVLLDPAYKGKIIWHDPRIEGTGATFFPFLANVLGDDGLRHLLSAQEPVFVTNFNDPAQALIRGKAHLALGDTIGTVFDSYRQAGLDFDIRPLGNTPDTSWLSTDGSTLGVFNQRPHPNAARVFVNWIMSQRIAALMAKASGYSSRRLDVPLLDPANGVIPGAVYVQSSIEENDALARHWMAEAARLHA